MYRRRTSALFAVMLFIISTSSVLAVSRNVKLRVKGMTCGGCATSVEKALKATDGVQQVRVSYERGTAIVKYDDQKVTVEQLQRVVKNTGFSCDLPSTDSSTHKR
jgi:copper chaperone